MAAFAGVDHLSLSVSDLDVSQRFYTEVLGFFFVTDFGDARYFIDRGTGFGLTLIRHPGGDSAPFTELHIGMDHIGLTAASRDELVEWQTRFVEAGVTFTPIRDMPFASHLNFRDPDNIPLEFTVPTAAYIEAERELREGHPTQEEIDARVAELLGASPVVG